MVSSSLGKRCFWAAGRRVNIRAGSELGVLPAGRICAQAVACVCNYFPFTGGKCMLGSSI